MSESRSNETAKIVACPACSGDSRYAAGNPYRPFCSARCKQIDLGAWASEQFRVQAEPPADPDTAPWPTPAH